MGCKPSKQKRPSIIQVKPSHLESFHYEIKKKHQIDLSKINAPVRRDMRTTDIPVHRIISSKSYDSDIDVWKQLESLDHVLRSSTSPTPRPPFKVDEMSSSSIANTSTSPQTTYSPDKQVKDMNDQNYLYECPHCQLAFYSEEEYRSHCQYSKLHLLRTLEHDHTKSIVKLALEHIDQESSIRSSRRDSVTSSRTTLIARASQSQSRRESSNNNNNSNNNTSSTLSPRRDETRPLSTNVTSNRTILI